MNFALYRPGQWPRQPTETLGDRASHTFEPLMVLAAMVGDGIEVKRGLNWRPSSTSAAWPSSWKQQRWKGLPIIWYKARVF